MTQKWDTTTYPKSAVGDDVDDLFARLIDGIDTAITHYYGTADPSTGSWGAAQLGAIWIESDNAIGGSGDDEGAVWKIWSILDSTPTYGWREISVRAIFDESPNTNKLNLASQSTTAFTNCDVSGDLGSYGERAQAVYLAVQVEDSGTPSSSVYASFRPDGVTTDAQEQRVYPQAAGVPVTAFLRVPLGTGGIFEYDINASGAGTFGLRVDILGWEERPS